MYSLGCLWYENKQGSNACIHLNPTFNQVTFKIKLQSVRKIKIKENSLVEYSAGRTTKIAWLCLLVYLSENLYCSKTKITAKIVRSTSPSLNITMNCVFYLFIGIPCNQCVTQGAGAKTSWPKLVTVDRPVVIRTWPQSSSAGSLVMTAMWIRFVKISTITADNNHIFLIGLWSVT